MRSISLIINFAGHKNYVFAGFESLFIALQTRSPTAHFFDSLIKDDATSISMIFGSDTIILFNNSFPIFHKTGIFTSLRE